MVIYRILDPSSINVSKYNDSFLHSLNYYVRNFHSRKFSSGKSGTLKIRFKCNGM